MIRITMKDGGVIDIALDAKAAPITVENFEKLVKDHFYDGLIFHRVIPGFMIQGGDPQGTGMGGPGWHIKGPRTPTAPEASSSSCMQMPTIWMASMPHSEKL